VADLGGVIRIRQYLSGVAAAMVANRSGTEAPVRVVGYSTGSNGLEHLFQNRSMCSKINTQKRRRGAVKGLDLGIVQSWRELNPGYEPGFLHLEDSTSPPIK
jgi:hypothetical protein